MKAKLAKIVVLTILLTPLLAAMGCFATRESFHLGHRYEWIEEYENIYLCEQHLYVSFRANTRPVVKGIDLYVRLTGASEQRHQPRFLHLNLDEVEWAELRIGPYVPSEVTPEFAAGSIPIDTAHCDWLSFLEGTGVLKNLMLEALLHQDFVVAKGYRGLIIARRREAGAEWAYASVPWRRSVRAPWSYTACALAFLPSVALDIVTFPLDLALSLQH